MFGGSRYLSFLIKCHAGCLTAPPPDIRPPTITIVPLVAARPAKAYSCSPHRYRRPLLGLSTDPSLPVCQLRTELVSSHPIPVQQAAALLLIPPPRSEYRRPNKHNQTARGWSTSAVACCWRRSQPPRCGVALLSRVTFLVVCLISYYYPLFSRLDSAQSRSSSLIAASRIVGRTKRKESSRSCACSGYF